MSNRRRSNQKAKDAFNRDEEKMRKRLQRFYGDTVVEDLDSDDQDQIAIAKTIRRDETANMTVAVSSGNETDSVRVVEEVRASMVSP